MSIVKLTPATNGGSVQLKAPNDTSGADVVLTLPNTDGDANQLLKTDGSGNLSWADDTDTTNTNASNLSSGTLPDARFPATLPAVSGANLTGIASPLNNRNILINGAMRIRQRGDVANAGNEYGGPDRWFFWKNDGAFNISQTDTVPAGQGFKNSYKIDCTSVSGTSGANYVGILQKLEGVDVQRLKYGSSNAESLTLSFWIRSTKTGTYIATLENKDQTKHISKSYTVSASNTWEKKTITFPGDTAAGFDNDTGESLKLILWVFAGSSYTSGTLATSWASVVDANSAVGQVNAGDNTSNDIYFTGIQLEPGTTATEFEHRSYHDELNRCLRYYWNVAKGNDVAFVSGYAHSSSYLNWLHRFPVPMRATPSLEQTTGTNYYNVEQHGTHYYLTGFGGVERGNTYAIQTWTALSTTQGSGVRVRTYNASASYAYKAEL